MKNILDNRFPSARAHVAPVALICLLTLLFFLPRLFGLTFSNVGQHMYATYPWAGITPLTPGVPTRVYPQTDHAETYYPMSVFATQAWRSGEVPMWMPYSFGGFPILELGMTSMLYPPRILLALLFDPPWQHDLMMFLHLLVAGLGMYALLRCWGANAPGSVLAAIVWQFNGHNVFWLVIEQMAIVAAWCPLMLLAATLAVRRRSFNWAIVAGLATGLPLYSGGTHYVHLSGWLLAVWYGASAGRALWVAWRRGERRGALVFPLLPLTSLFVAAAVGLAYWLPLWRVLPDVSRQPFSLKMQFRLATTWPTLLRTMLLPAHALELSELAGQLSAIFTGLLPVALAVIALCLNRSLHVRLALLFAALALLSVTGVYWWVKLLHDYAPFFNTMELHVAFYVYSFALAVLAGFGLHELVQRWPQRENRRRYIWAIALVVLAGLVQTTVLGWSFAKFFKLGPSKILALLSQPRFALLALLIFATLGFVAVGYARWQTGQVKSRAGLLELLRPSYVACWVAAGHLFLFAWQTNPYQLASRAWFFPETPLIKTLQEWRGEYRLLPVYHNTTVWMPPMFPGKSAAIFRLHSANGYESLLPTRTTLLWLLVQTALSGEAVATLFDNPKGAYRPYFHHDRLPLALLEKLSIGLLVTPPKVEPLDAQSGRNLVADGTLRVIYQGADGYIYANARALKRVFLVPKVVQVADQRQALQTLASPDFDARQAALIEHALPPRDQALLQTAQPDGAALARIVRESLNEVEIETAGASASLLVFNDSWASDWRATVDGAAQAVHCVNFNARGVVLPAGQHRVVFRYRPAALLASLGISAAVLLLLTTFLAVLLGRRVFRQRQRLN